eukprot:3442160-Pleurochrysis_carterae.AAC.1
MCVTSSFDIRMYVPFSISAGLVKSLSIGCPAYFSSCAGFISSSFSTLCDPLPSRPPMSLLASMSSVSGGSSHSPPPSLCPGRSETL